MEELRVNCPYCDKEIDNNVEQCPYCKEFFKEPNINGIKLKSIGQYIVFDILTFGIFSVLWVLINRKAFIDIAIRKKDKIKLTNYVIIMILACLFIPVFHSLALLCIKIIQLFISYRMLRIIQKYTLKKYGVRIFHSEIGWFVFNILYVVYYIDTYKEKVYNPDVRFHLNFSGWLKYILILCVPALLLLMFAMVFAHSVSLLGN